MLSSSDKTILRELARQQLEVAHSEKTRRVWPYGSATMRYTANVR